MISSAHLTFFFTLLLCVVTVPLTAQTPRQILDASAEMYRRLHSLEASGILATRVTRAGIDYKVRWPVSVAYADSTMLPADSPVPVLSPLQRLGQIEFLDPSGKPANEPGVLASPKGWSLFGQTNQGAATVRRLPDEAVSAAEDLRCCVVLEVDYERGHPSRALSEHPIRYWIEPSTHIVRRVSFSLRDAASQEVLEWDFTAESVRTNQRPPRWALQSLAQLAGDERPEWVGRPAPEFSLPDLEGRRVSLGDLRGKAVLLSFWASWCVPCKEELPLIARLREEWAPRGVEAWGMTNESAEKAAGWLREQGIDLPTLVDVERAAFRSYEAEQIPVSVVVDRNGLVVSYLVGLGGEAHFRDAIERALEGSTSAAR